MTLAKLWGKVMKKHARPENMAGTRNYVAVVLLFLSVIFILIGAMRGEIGIVLIRAVFICMECIGIG